MRVWGITSLSLGEDYQERIAFVYGHSQCDPVLRQFLLAIHLLMISHLHADTEVLIDSAEILLNGVEAKLLEELEELEQAHEPSAIYEEQ